MRPRSRKFRVVGGCLDPISVTGGAKTTFMAGPATPPEGVGSLQLKVTTRDVPALIDYQLGAPVPLASVTGSWSTYVEAGQEAGSAGVEARRRAGFRGDESPSNQRNQGTVTPGTWQTWTLSDASVVWGSAGAVPTVAPVLLRRRSKKLHPSDDSQRGAARCRLLLRRTARRRGARQRRRRASHVRGRVPRHGLRRAASAGSGGRQLRHGTRSPARGPRSVRCPPERRRHRQSPPVRGIAVDSRRTEPSPWGPTVASPTRPRPVSAARTRSATWRRTPCGTCHRCRRPSPSR